MIISRKVRKQMEESSWVRKMFEEGMRMKSLYGEDHVYDFSLGNPDVEPPEQIERALIDIVTHPTPGMHRYMPNNGYEDVRTFVAQHLREELGVPFTARHIYMSAGSAGGLNILLKAILNRGEEVIVPSPYFMEFKHYIQSHGGVLRLVDTADDFQLDVGKIASAMTKMTRAVLLNSPNNPTGVVYREKVLKELADLLYDWRRKGRKVFIIADDAYRRLVYDNLEPPNLFRLYDMVISVTSHSKDLALPGERIGYIAVSPEIKEIDDLTTALMFASRALGL